jgi:hypothetical protein
MAEYPKSSARRLSAPGLIAWLSVCLLAAAWGRTLSAAWQALWAEMGAFGLAAAVGLEAMHHVRALRAAVLRRRAQHERAESGLSRLDEHTAALDSINIAVRRLTDDLHKHKRGQARLPGMSKRHWEAHALSHYPLDITPIDDSGEADWRSIRPITGCVQCISSSAISFEHDQPFPTQVVLVTFRLSTGDRVSFVVDVVWTENKAEGLVSTGTMLAVGIPHDGQVAASLAG